ncbi:hypothetical protein [Methanocella arvoryzae]|uniref:Bulb-type lectin domain-containing protein n=1 Tax=Methanocella arvoryzae (strain DSM 22066 / NBRC 105507 / MRE50) TaxID=351160 RepID=Q0W3P9_METAR|nr:hypothetical protein [Methanocella arvoryzae]CAJ36994.1 hypothetical protein RCIX1797 [Methanocella arvoryzae MRE50]
MQARPADSPPQIEWSKAYDWGYYDYGSSVARTGDGGYAVTGGTSPTYKGDRDAFLLKTDRNGNQLWKRTYGGESFDYGYAVIETADGGYAIAGTTESYGQGSGDVYLVRTDAAGNPLWEKTFGGPGYDEGRALLQTPDGGYLIAGVTESFGNGSSDIYLIKTDARGEKEWDRAYGGAYNDLALSIEPTTDGGYIIAGSHGVTANSSAAYLLKIDAGGHWQWDQKLGGYKDSVAYYARQTADGGFIAVGYDNLREGPSSVCLFKLDAGGNLMWQKAFSGSGTQKGYNVHETPGGDYVIIGMAGVGDSNSSGMRYESLLIRTDFAGEVRWLQTYGADRDVFTRAGTMTADGDLVIVGSTGSPGDVETWDVYLAKFTGT